VITRRELLAGALSTGALACRPTSVYRTAPPQVTHGVQAGDVQGDRALVWARSSEPARMQIEWATTESFANPTRVAGPVVGPDRDFAATVPITGLPAGQTIFYRARFSREADRGDGGWVTAIRFAWTGDTCGQGFGRNPEWGGMLGYKAIREARPDFMLHSGDLIYADNPIVAEVKLADGRVWKNVTNDKVAKVAETLDEFRARFAYNLEDEHVRALAAEVPILAQWDDHETHNNWWPGQILDDDRYAIKDASTLAARAYQATFEWTPIGGPPVNRVVHYGALLDVLVVDLRSFRSPNDTATAMMGDAQVRWFIDAVTASKARWKIIACDQPLALVIPDGPNNDRREGFADGTPAANGRERELATIFAALKKRHVKNVIWLTADVHYAAAHHFDPARAAIADFDPFWEFVAGPIHAGTFGPNPLDPTFGPELEFQWVPPDGQGSLAPWDGMQTFGTVELTASAATVRVHDVKGEEKYRVEIEAT